MKLDKAIEILSASANKGVTTFNQDYKDAQKLLIEAGKKLIALRTGTAYTYGDLLPGETKE